jgi:hypothetical protein
MIKLVILCAVSHISLIESKNIDILVSHFFIKFFLHNVEKSFACRDFLNMLKIEYPDLQMVQFIILCTVNHNLLVESKNIDILFLIFLPKNFAQCQKKF